MNFEASLFIPLLITGAFAAAFVIGAVGFADALIMNAIWLHIMPPHQATALILACGIVMHIGPLIKLHKILDFSRLPIFLVAGVLGVPLGVYAISLISAQNFKTAIAILLLSYGAWMLVRPNSSIGERGGKPADGTIGLAGGFLGGFAGLSGLLPTLWTGLRGWDKHRQRGVFQPFVLVMHFVGFATFLASGMITSQIWTALLWCLPAILIGSFFGVKIYPYINEAMFRKSVLALLILSGLTLLL